jgi:FtsZ-binding cell division protein ZapB
MKLHSQRWWQLPRPRTLHNPKAMNAAQPERELDSLSHLEERITKAVELVSNLRAEKAALEEQLASAIDERDAVRAELDELRSERRHVRTRIEKLLGQMELLSSN